MAINVNNLRVYNMTVGAGSGGGSGVGGGGGGIPIDTTNLLFFLDASDSTSYSGTGTTWNDISGNNHHFEDMAGANSNVFVSAGTSSHFSWTNTDHQFQLIDTDALEPDVTGSSPSYSFSTWIRKDSSHLGTNSVMPFDMRIGRLEMNNGVVWNGGTVNLLGSFSAPNFKLDNSPLVSYPQFVDFSSYYDTWVNLAITFTFPTPTTRRVVAYVNANVIMTEDAAWGFDEFITTELDRFNLLIGGNGDIANFAFYNRELSASEVLANYNALSSRF